MSCRSVHIREVWGCVGAGQAGDGPMTTVDVVNGISLDESPQGDGTSWPRSLPPLLSAVRPAVYAALMVLYGHDRSAGSAGPGAVATLLRHRASVGMGRGCRLG